MNRHLFLLLLFFIPLINYSQDVDTNAMLQQLVEMPKDSNKVFFLLQVGDLWEYSDPDRAISYYQQAVQLSEEINYPFGQGRAWQYQGVVLNTSGRYAEAIEANQQASNRFASIGDSTYFAMSQVNIGNGYNFQGAYEVALEYYLEAAAIFEQLGKTGFYLIVLGNIQNIYTNMNDRPKQLEYGQKMLELASVSDSLMLGDTYQKYGVALLDNRRFVAAKPFLDTALLIGQAIQNPVSIIIAVSNLGLFHFKQEQYAQALPYYLQCSALARDHGDPYYLGRALSDVGKTMNQLGRFQEAQPYLEEALQITLAAGQRESALSAYGHLAAAEEELGNYQKALDHWERYNELRDTVFNQNTRNQIAALDIRFQTAQRQNRIKTLEAENQIQALRLRQRNIILWALAAGLAILLTLLYLIRRNAKQRQELARQAAELQKQEISRLEQERDLVALRSRIEGEHQERLRIAEDLHDDFGSGLSKISLLSEVVKKEAQQELPSLNKIIASSRQLQRKMGEIVWALNTGNDSLASLVAYLRRYLAEFFDDTSIQYHFQAPNQIPDYELSGEERRNLFLVVKEALHNVLKHSQADQTTVSVELDKSQLAILVADNGQGFPAEQEAYGSGLRNMEKRMESLSGSLSITSDQGTEVRLLFPLG